MVKKIYKFDNNIQITHANVLEIYDSWPSPIAIVSDGPYGVNGFKGDLPTKEGLKDWYEPHVKKWTEKATPQTTLWFWNTEIGWASVHPLLESYGWQYVNCHVWDKGLAHIAGNSNTKKSKKLPIVTEVCVQYVKKPIFKNGGKDLSMKEWMINEWKRTGLPFSATNKAAGVKDAATRKYFTKDHLWYSPPSEVYQKLSDYANRHGDQKGRPFFSINGKDSLTRVQWEGLKAKFKCPMGITNVWHVKTLKGKERFKVGSKAFHLNQKPLELMKLIIELSTDKKDIVWEPFGGLATAAIASNILDRKCFTAEVDKRIYNVAIERFKAYQNQNKLNKFV